MFTLFTIPKAFAGHIGVIQRNAIGSWVRLRHEGQPQPEIILFGNDPGTGEIARELGLRHISDIATNEFGTPLLDDLFHKAEAAARFPTLCYANADIVLLSSFLHAAELVRRRFPRSLVVSKRINVELPEPLDFGSGWQEALERRAKATGFDGHYSAIDIFLFPKGMYSEIPDFAIGRLWFDHWLIKAVRQQNLPVVDASSIAPLLHQQHDYDHVPGGADQVLRGKEAERNFRLYGGVRHAYTLLDVTHEFAASGAIRRVRFRKPLYRIREFAWRVFVERTVGVRDSLRLRRKFWQKSSVSSGS